MILRQFSYVSRINISLIFWNRKNFRFHTTALAGSATIVPDSAQQVGVLGVAEASNTRHWLAFSS